MGNKMAIVSWPNSVEDGNIRKQLQILASNYNLKESEQPLGIEQGRSIFAVDISGLGLWVQPEKSLDHFLDAARDLLVRRLGLTHVVCKRESLMV